MVYERLTNISNSISGGGNMKSKFCKAYLSLLLFLIMNIWSSAVADQNPPGQSSIPWWGTGLLSIATLLIGFFLQYLLSRRNMKIREGELRVKEQELDLKESQLKLNAKEFSLRTGEQPFDEESEREKGVTPATFEEEYDRKKRLIDEIGVPVSAEDANYSNSQALSKLVDRHKEIADSLWSSGEVSNGYRSAYSYTLAAYACKRAEKCSDAGRFYHFAGHRFRELGEYELAGMCYKWAGDLYKRDSSKEPNALRAYRRAGRAFSHVGDQYIVDEIRKLETEIAEKIRPTVGELGWWNEPGAFRKQSPY